MGDLLLASPRVRGGHPLARTSLTHTENYGCQVVKDSHDLPPIGQRVVGGSTAVGRGVQACTNALAPKLGVLNLVHTWLRRGGDLR